jgi:hypothetical protein
MENTHIHQLIDKYLAGETSVADETQLKEFFQQPDIPEDLLPYKQLFQFFDQTSQLTVSDSFEATLTANLNRRQMKGGRIQTYRVLAYAATLALVISTFLWLDSRLDTSHPAQVNWEKYEVTDEELALQETMEALELLANKLNGSAKKSTQSIKRIEKAAIIFE